MEHSHIGNLVFENAKKYGQKVALKYKDNISNRWMSVSWSELCERVKQIAEFFMCFFIGQPQQAEHLALKRGIGYPYRTAGKLYSVEHQVIRLGAYF